MQDDLNTLYSTYVNNVKNDLPINESNASINNTTRNNDSYMYSPIEYSQSREEQEENKTTKMDITKVLQKCAEISKTGLAENYKKILLDLHDIQKKIQSILLSK